MHSPTLGTKMRQTRKMFQLIRTNQVTNKSTHVHLELREQRKIESTPNPHQVLKNTTVTRRSEETACTCTHTLIDQSQSLTYHTKETVKWTSQNNQASKKVPITYTVLKNPGVTRQNAVECLANCHSSEFCLGCLSDAICQKGKRRNGEGVLVTNHKPHRNPVAEKRQPQR